MNIDDLLTVTMLSEVFTVMAMTLLFLVASADKGYDHMKKILDETDLNYEFYYYYLAIGIAISLTIAVFLKNIHILIANLFLFKLIMIVYTYLILPNKYLIFIFIEIEFIGYVYSYNKYIVPFQLLVPPLMIFPTIIDDLFKNELS